MGLSTGQIFVVTASLLAVGGVTLYFIHQQKEPSGAPPAKRMKKSIAHAPHGIRQVAQHAASRMAHEYPLPHAEQQHPQYAWAPPSPAPSYAPSQQEAFHPPVMHARVPTPYSAPIAPPSDHTDPVTYTPFPMPQPTATHEWPRQQPSDIQPAAQALSPTYWRDLATKMGALIPTAPLMTVQDAQRYLNTLGAAPHGEVLKIDNIHGPRTTNAISNFQELHHIPMTGNLDPETGAAILYDVYNLYLAQAGGDVAHVHQG